MHYGVELNTVACNAFYLI